VRARRRAARSMSSVDAAVAIVGGGVVGAAVAHALAGVGTGALLLEAEEGLALGASGTNSGILHTGFDSAPGQLEAALILRAAARRARHARARLRRNAHATRRRRARGGAGARGERARQRHRDGAR